MFEVLYKSKNLIVINKPPLIPSQSDLGGDKDAMTLCSEMLKANNENPNLWLIHRLDRIVGGVLCFARNKKFAALMSQAIQDRRITKEYFAIVEGETESSGEVTLSDYIFKDAKKNKAFIVDKKRAGVKDAKLIYKTLDRADSEKGVRSLVKIELLTGRFHQIRAQFSNRGLPISGDGKYGSHDNKAKNIALFACRLAFSVGGEKVDVTTTPNLEEYPWSMFDKKFFN